jgi:hypothetical protein
MPWPAATHIEPVEQGRGEARPASTPSLHGGSTASRGRRGRLQRRSSGRSKGAARRGPHPHLLLAPVLPAADRCSSQHPSSPAQRRRPAYCTDFKFLSYVFGESAPHGLTENLLGFETDRLSIAATLFHICCNCLPAMLKLAIALQNGVQWVAIVLT